MLVHSETFGPLIDGEFFAILFKVPSKLNQACLKRFPDNMAFQRDVEMTFESNPPARRVQAEEPDGLHAHRSTHALVTGPGYDDGQACDTGWQAWLHCLGCFCLFFGSWGLTNSFGTSQPPAQVSSHIPPCSLAALVYRTLQTPTIITRSMWTTDSYAIYTDQKVFTRVTMNGASSLISHRRPSPGLDQFKHSSWWRGGRFRALFLTMAI